MEHLRPLPKICENRAVNLNTVARTGKIARPTELTSNDRASNSSSPVPNSAANKTSSKPNPPPAVSNSLLRCSSPNSVRRLPHPNRLQPSPLPITNPDEFQPVPTNFNQFEPLAPPLASRPYEPALPAGPDLRATTRTSDSRPKPKSKGRSSKWKAGLNLWDAPFANLSKMSLKPFGVRCVDVYVYLTERSKILNLHAR